MKNISVLSTVFALAATTSMASEATYHTTPSRRIQTTGRAHATILDPVSVSISKNIQFSASPERIAKNGKIRAVNQGEIHLLGPKNQLVSVNVQNAETTEKAPKKPRLINNSRLVALDGVTGEAKIRIGGVLNAKKNLNSKSNSSEVYVFQVSY